MNHKWNYRPITPEQAETSQTLAQELGISPILGQLLVPVSYTHLKQLYPGRTTNCMISMQASSEDSQYDSVISILTPMYMDELSAWKDTTPEHRGESYRSFKQEKTKQLLRFIRSYNVLRHYG